MSTSTQDLPYYSKLREALLEYYDDKTNIRRLTRDAGIDWGDVDPDGSPRATWDDVLIHARKQRRVRPLIEKALGQFSKSATLRQALQDFDPDQEFIVSNGELEKLNEELMLLQIPALDSDGGRPQFFGLTEIIPGSLLDLIFSKKAPTQSEFRATFSGGYTRTAASALQKYEWDSGQRRSAIQQTIARVKSELAKIDSKIRTIESTRQPEMPRQPEYLSGAPFNILSSDTEALKKHYEYQARQNEQNKRNHESAMRRYEQSLQEYKQQQLDLPGYRFERNQLSQQVDQSTSELARFEREFQDGCRRLNDEKEIARSRDLVQVLTELEATAASQLSAEASVGRGFVLGLMLRVIAAMTERWLDPSSLLAAKQVSNDAGEMIDEAVRNQYRSIGSALLSRCQVVDHAAKEIDHEIQDIQALLETLPNEKLAEVQSAAEKLLKEPKFDSVPSYKNTDSEAELNKIKSALTATQAGILAAGVARRQLLDSTVDLLPNVTAVHADAKTHVDKIENAASQLKPFAAEACTLWGIMSRAVLESEMAMAFSSAFKREATRRFEAFSRLMARCDYRGDFLNGGEQVLSRHVSSLFVRDRAAVQKDLDSLGALKKSYDHALEDIDQEPNRIAGSNSTLLTALAIVAWIPFVNAVCAGVFLGSLASLKEWLSSELAPMVNLRKRAKAMAILMLVLALTSTLVLFLNFDQTQTWLDTKGENMRVVAPLAIVADILTMVLSIWSWAKLKRVAQASHQPG